jgi:hypothetical protein
MVGPLLYPSNLKKYPGSIIEYKSKYIFMVYKNSCKHKIHEIKFGENKTKEKAKNEIIKYKKDWGIKNNLVKNKYYVNDNELNIYLGKNIWFLADVNDLNFVDKYIWNVSRGKYIKYAITLSPKNERKDINKKEYKKFHNYITKSKDVNHKNSNTLDNRKNNLMLLNNITLNNNNLNNKIKYKLRKDNTSGHSCIYRGNYKDYEYWQVKGNDFHGKKINKKFSVNKFGEEKSKQMAIEYKINFIDMTF